MGTRIKYIDYKNMVKLGMISKYTVQTINHYTKKYEYPKYITDNRLYMRYGVFLEIIIRRLFIEKNKYMGRSKIYPINTIDKETYKINTNYKNLQWCNISPVGTVSGKERLYNIDEIVKLYCYINCVNTIEMRDDLRHQFELYKDDDWGKVDLVKSPFIKRFIEAYLSFRNVEKNTVDVLRDIWFISPFIQASSGIIDMKYYTEFGGQNDDLINLEMLNELRNYVNNINDAKCDIKFTIQGFYCSRLDFIFDNIIVDIKTSKNDEDRKENIMQLLSYAFIMDKVIPGINKVKTFNPLSGKENIYTFNMDSTKCLKYMIDNKLTFINEDTDIDFKNSMYELISKPNFNIITDNTHKDIELYDVSTVILKTIDQINEESKLSGNMVGINVNCDCTICDKQDKYDFNDLYNL
ncbi:hypothetical protein F-S17_0216 [Faustovirus]|nr:hypothetical protein F-S17_0216 [Faustovirus]QJX73991.1 hypothetical protein F-E9_237 [Faustovirus]